jgi:hypothetical protein
MINKAQPQPPCRPLLVLSHRPFESHFHSPRALSLHHPNLSTQPLTPINTLYKQCLDAAKAERYFPFLLLQVEQLLTWFPSKGLGKGGAKRHRKILRDNIQGT